MTKFPSFDDRRNLVSYSCSTPKITLETIYHSNASLYIGAKVLRAALLYNGNPHSCNDGLCIGTVPIMHAIFKVVRNNLYPPTHTHTHNTHTHTHIRLLHSTISYVASNPNICIRNNRLHAVFHNLSQWGDQIWVYEWNSQMAFEWRTLQRRNWSYSSLVLTPARYIKRFRGIDRYVKHFRVCILVRALVKRNVFSIGAQLFVESLRLRGHTIYGIQTLINYI